MAHPKRQFNPLIQKKKKIKVQKLDSSSHPTTDQWEHLATFCEVGDAQKLKQCQHSGVVTCIAFFFKRNG